MAFTPFQDNLSGPNINLLRFSLESQQQVIPLIQTINALLIGKIQPIVRGAPTIVDQKTLDAIDLLLNNWRGKKDIVGQTKDAVIYVEGVVRHALGIS